MEHRGPEHTEPELDALLRRCRPEPDGTWVRATGEQLFPPREPKPAWRLGAALAGGLATVAAGLALGGVGPLGSTNQPVQADDSCRTVTVTRVERVPSIVTGPKGGLRVTYTKKPVRATEQRCG